MIQRSREILRNLEADELTPEGLPRLAERVGPGALEPQLSLSLGEPQPSPTNVAEPAHSIAEEEVLHALRGLDPDQTTPMDALLALRDLTRRLQAPPDKPEPS